MWSDYGDTHSYDRASREEKVAFVEQAAAQGRCKVVWDLGSNTGAFSELLESRADHVISVDADHECVERLYLRLRARDGRKILPLVMNLANPSPNQGWASGERLAFDSRNKPDLILGLALIHHICLGNNVPISNFLDWLVMTPARLIIEFVDRSDSMVREILERKTEAHEDYSLANFERELRRRLRFFPPRRSSEENGGSTIALRWRSGGGRAQNANRYSRSMVARVCDSRSTT